MTLKIEETYIEVFMGAIYELGDPQTVGELKSLLEEIVSDLPPDEDLKIREVYLHENKLSYVLVDGIPR